MKPLVWFNVKVRGNRSCADYYFVYIYISSLSCIQEVFHSYDSISSCWVFCVFFSWRDFQTKQFFVFPPKTLSSILLHLFAFALQIWKQRWSPPAHEAEWKRKLILPKMQYNPEFQFVASMFHRAWLLKDIHVYVTDAKFGRKGKLHKFPDEMVSFVTELWPSERSQF